VGATPLLTGTPASLAPVRIAPILATCRGPTATRAAIRSGPLRRVASTPIPETSRGRSAHGR
jgi:hypothetical protein